MVSIRRRAGGGGGSPSPHYIHSYTLCTHARTRHQLRAGLEQEVVGVGQDDLRLGVAELLRREALHRGLNCCFVWWRLGRSGGPVGFGIPMHSHTFTYTKHPPTYLGPTEDERRGQHLPVGRPQLAAARGPARRVALFVCVCCWVWGGVRMSGFRLDWVQV